LYRDEPRDPIDSRPFEGRPAIQARRAAEALAVTVCVAVAGCGGDDEPESSGGQGAAAPAASTVEMSEYKFSPGSVTFKRGETVAVPNEGAIPHDLKLREAGKVVGGTKVVDAGQSTDFKVDVKPGPTRCSAPCRATRRAA
jgi:plastocyanin